MHPWVKKHPILFLLALVLWLALTLAVTQVGAADRKTCQALESTQVQKYGCALSERTDAGARRWHLRVWITWLDSRPQWESLYAIRGDRRTALRDCDRWMECVDRQLRQAVKERK